MARQSRAPITHIVNAAPVQQAPIVQVVQATAPLPTFPDAATASAISAKPYPSWTATEKRWMQDYEKTLGKAGSGSYAFFGLSADNPRVFSVDVNLIDLTHANAKKAGDGRPYLWSLDGQTFEYQGEKFNVSTFYALRQRR